MVLRLPFCCVEESNEAPASAACDNASPAQQLLSVLAPLRNVVEVWQVPYGSCVLTIMLDTPCWQYLSSPDTAWLSQQRLSQRTTVDQQSGQSSDPHMPWLPASDHRQCWICNVQTGAVLDISKVLLQRQ